MVSNTLLTKSIVPIMPKITNHSNFYYATCWLVFLNIFLFALSMLMDMCCFLTIHYYRPSLFWGLWGNISWLLWPQWWFRNGHFPNELNMPLPAFCEHRLAIFKYINLSIIKCWSWEWFLRVFNLFLPFPSWKI